MREMKDSGNMWIGATPETWKMIPLKYLASYNDEVLSENTDDEFEFDYIEIGSVQYGRGIIYTEHMKFKNAPSRARRIVRKDDIIVSTVRTYLKAVATIPACNNSLIASTGFIVIRPHKVLPRFMNYALLSESFISLVESHSTGISYPAINSVDVVKFKIPVPCRSEQERIAAFLDAECAEIDAVLEKTRASIEEYKKLKQAVITQAVTKGIRGDRPMKDSGIEWIGDIPVEWDYTKAKNCVNIQNGSDPKTEGSIPVYGSGASSFKTCGEYKEGPSVLIGRKGATLHIPHYISTKFWNVDTAFNVYAKPNFDLKFYFYCACSFDYRFYISQTTLPSMTQTAYENMFLPLPSNDEQRAIASYLDNRCEEIDALIWKKQECLVEIENYKKSLIYEYVTGKKEVV